MKKIVNFLLIVGMSSGAVHAGFKALTWHSRANCLTINESISWEFNKAHTLRTRGEHYSDINHGLQSHTLDSKWETTWRSSVLHMNEGYGGWQVKAKHEFYEDNKIKTTYTDTTNCSIYDGWWDQDHPERKI